jgi:hypothetical protein
MGFFAIARPYIILYGYAWHTLHGIATHRTHRQSKAYNFRGEAMLAVVSEASAVQRHVPKMVHMQHQLLSTKGRA